MSKPLQPKRKTQNERNKFHRDVFALWGNRCYFCEGYATDAMHVIKCGSRMGRNRYCDPRIARPGCRRCHELEDVGKIKFPLELRIEVTLVINQYTKVPYPLPVE